MHLELQTVDKRNSHIHEEGWVGTNYVRAHAPLMKGQRHEGHAHFIDHTSELSFGAVDLYFWNPKTDNHGHVIVEVQPPPPGYPIPRSIKLPIDADVWHLFIAREDNTLLSCWFSSAEMEAKYGSAILNTGEKSSTPEQEKRWAELCKMWGV